jgi:hypothetical protein
MSSGLKQYMISANPSLFDAFFKGLHWGGSGHVKVIKIDGGLELLEVVIEADQQACLELKAAGFNLRPAKD